MLLPHQLQHAGYISPGVQSKPTNQAPRPAILRHSSLPLHCFLGHSLTTVISLLRKRPCHLPPMLAFASAPLPIWSRLAVSASGPNTSSRAALVQSGTHAAGPLRSSDGSALPNAESFSAGLLCARACRSTPAEVLSDNVRNTDLRLEDETPHPELLASRPAPSLPEFTVLLMALHCLMPHPSVVVYCSLGQVHTCTGVVHVQSRWELHH